MNIKYFFIGVSLALLVIAIPVISYLVITNASFESNNGPLISPIGQTTIPSVLSASTSRKKVFGFLPYWNFSDEDSQNLKNVDTVYYFALSVNGDGSFDKTDPGYSQMAQLTKYNRKFGITLTNMDGGNIAAVVSSLTTRKRLIDNTINLIKQNQFLSYDVNLDFEDTGMINDNLRQNFTTLVNELAAAIHANGGTLSVATLADSVLKTRLYDIKAISQQADYIIVMAYDFTRLDSIEAGPVAPLFGKERYEYDVYTTVTDYLSASSPDKIVLGIPFYGYEWPVASDQPDAFVLGASTTGPEVSSYKRTEEVIAENKAAVNFDDYSKTPWFAYFDKDSKTWRQTWFENEQSLGLKLDLVNQANLAGIAIWALGYEGIVPENTSNPLWTTIKEKLQ